VLKLEKQLAQLPAGEGLVVFATDSMAKIDIPLYCRQGGHTCSVSETKGVLRFEIAKGGGP
jgi:tRNA 2-thiouridine synthesizing protein A